MKGRYRRDRATYRLTVCERLERRHLLHAADVVAVTAGAEGEGELVADFSLVDVNPNSATYNQAVSPRDYMGQLSAWYFGHGT
jgi:hypothetical protein